MLVCNSMLCSMIWYCRNPSDLVHCGMTGLLRVLRNCERCHQHTVSVLDTSWRARFYHHSLVVPGVDPSLWVYRHPVEQGLEEARAPLADRRKRTKKGWMVTANRCPCYASKEISPSGSWETHKIKLVGTESRWNLQVTVWWVSASWGLWCTTFCIRKHMRDGFKSLQCADIESTVDCSWQVPDRLKNVS